MKSGMTHVFSQVPKANIPRSKFNRTARHRTTFDAGYLIPFFVDEVLPGDTFNVRTTAFCRLQTPIVPVMDNLKMDFFYFFVPNRLVWSNWKKFMGEQANPGDSTSYLIPYTTVNNASIGSLWDYFGLPTGVAQNMYVNNLHGRAYNLIWNEWFRDENLQNSVTVDLGDGPDTAGNYVPLRRGKRHDYYTSCLPFLQKGTAATLPLGTSAPIISDGSEPTFSAMPTPGGSGLTNRTMVVDNATVAMRVGGAASTASTTMKFGNNTGLIADLAGATPPTINSVRQAVAIQQLLEKDARGGTRYTEIVRSHFGVISPDARLQRPELLGTGSVPINIHPIAQTSATEAGTPQGNLAAFGVSAANGVGFTKSFTEHGVLIGMVSVRADLSYQQGMEKMWFRRTRLDFYWPSLANIGEQAVLNKEIYFQGTADDDLVFGYQERYGEYRYKNSLTTGKFRSTASGTLDIWHLSQKFTSLPVLNSTFIQENPPVSRVVAVNTEPQFYFDSQSDVICARPMPLYGVPGLMRL